jgi:chlorite dismutase
MSPVTKSAGTPPIDLSEHGAPRAGQPQLSDRRLYLQLLAFELAPGTARTQHCEKLGAAIERPLVRCVVYRDLNHPRGLAVLCACEDPELLINETAPVLADDQALTPRTEFTMLGRTYSTGFEPDLEHWLLRRPLETVLDESRPWAIWYPLRRTGAFERLLASDKSSVLREHAQIGRAYGAADLAHDVRLACHGLDARDNEFVIGLTGRELYPLSHVVKEMRSTRQTSEFVSSMGPFFVGHVAYRSRLA